MGCVMSLKQEESILSTSGSSGSDKWEDIFSTKFDKYKPIQK